MFSNPNGPSRMTLVYAGSMLFIGLASKGYVYADPTLLVALTFFCFAFLVVHKGQLPTNNYIETHRNTLRDQLISTHNSLTSALSARKEQEEILQLTTLVAEKTLSPTSVLINYDLNPFISGVYFTKLEEEYFLQSTYSDFHVLLQEVESENYRRLAFLLKKK